MRIPAPDFSLKHTVESGQLFRYDVYEGVYVLSHRDKAFAISQEGDELLVHAHTSTVTPEWLTHFFSLDVPAPTAIDAYSQEALLYCSGMRVCRQDPWECTVGFICSQNNNIKRIRQLMTGLAQAFGTRVQLGMYSTHLFVEPGKIRAGAKLSAIRSGYREKYLLGANALTDGWLASLHSLTYEEQRAALLSVHGIGPKVADCILLFAYGQSQAFPIDTWVSQIMHEQYGGGSHAQMQQTAQRVFGAQAGVLQQYLFHYRRQQK